MGVLHILFQAVTVPRYYVYLIEELFKNGLPLIKRKPWKETDRNRAPKMEKKEKKRKTEQCSRDRHTKMPRSHFVSGLIGCGQPIIE